MKRSAFFKSLAGLVIAPMAIVKAMEAPQPIKQFKCSPDDKWVDHGDVEFGDIEVIRFNPPYICKYPLTPDDCYKTGGIWAHLEKEAQKREALTEWLTIRH